MDRREELKERTERLRKKMDDLIEVGASAQDILAASMELDECFNEYFKIEAEEKEAERKKLEEKKDSKQ